jgi:O-antigen ligase
MLTIFLTTFNHKFGKKIVLITLLTASVKYINIQMLKQTLRQPIIKIMLITFFYMLISLSWSPDFQEGKGIVQNYVFYFLFPILVFSLIPDKKYIYMLIKVFVFTMFVNEIISYGILFDFWGSLDNLGFPTPFMHHTAYSMVVTIAIFIIGYELTQTRELRLRIIYFIFLLTMSGNLIISGGRNGQVTLFFIAFILALGYFRKSYKKALALFLAPVIVFIIAFFSYDQFQDRTIRIYTDTVSVIEKRDFRTSFGNRLFAFFIAEKYLEDYNFLVGEGVGSIKITKNNILEKHFTDTIHTNTTYTHFHQYYVSTLVQYGLIGLTLLFLLFYYFYKIKISDPKMNYIKILILLVMMISNLADGMLFIRSTMIIFAIFIGLILAQYRIENTTLKVKGDY